MFQGNFVFISQIEPKIVYEVLADKD